MSFRVYFFLVISRADGETLRDANGLPFRVEEINEI